MGIAIRALGIAIVLSASFELLCAQREYHLRLRVIDAAGKPVRKIRVIPVEPPRMPSRPTKSDGTTELLLPHYKVGNSFYVELFDAPRNLTFLPPLPPVPPSRCRTVMPTPPEPAELIVNKRGQRLTSSRALTTITSAILEKSFAKFANSGLTAVPRLSALLEIAELLGLKPKEIDQAIRALPEQTADSYEKGLVALYAQEYPDAIQLLSIFLQMQGKELGNAQESMGREMDATFFLGQALFEQAKYSDAADLFQKLTSLHPDDAKSVSALAVSLSRTGRNVQAEKILRNALDTVKDDRLARGMLLNNLGALYANLKQFDKALQVYLAVLAISQELKDPRTKERILRSLGAIHQEKGNYVRALEYYKRSWRINKYFGDNLSTGDILSDIATIYTIIGNQQQSSNYFLKAEAAYNIAEDASEQLNDKAAQALITFDVARLFEATGGYLLGLSGPTPIALLSYERSAELRQKALGEDHPDEATSLSRVANMYYVLGRYSAAEERYKRSLSIREKAFGEDSPEVAQSLNDLAGVYIAQDKCVDAEQLLKRSLSIKKKALGENSLEVAQSLNSLGELYYPEGKYGEAELLFKQALSIKEKALGPEHPLVAESLGNLAVLYFIQGRYARAEPLLKRSLMILEKALGGNRPNEAALLNNLAALYTRQAMYRKSEQLLKGSLMILEKALGEDHPKVAEVLNNLAEVYTREAKYTKAERLFKRALDIYEGSLGTDNLEVAILLNGYAQLLEKTNRKTEAATMELRAAAIRAEYEQKNAKKCRNVVLFNLN